MQRAPTKGDSGIVGLNVNALAAKLAKEFKSVAEIRQSAKSLKDFNQEIQDNFSDTARRMITEIEYLLVPQANANRISDWETLDRASVIIGEIADKGYTTEKQIADYMAREYKNTSYKYSKEVGEKILALFDYVRQMSDTDYFEAKPRRAVGFEEIRYVLTPENASDKLIKALDERGIKHTTYTDKNTRSEIIKNLDDAKFSLPEAEKPDKNAKKVYTKSESKDIIDEVLKKELQEKYGFEFKGGKGALITRLQESFNKTSEKNKLSTAMDIAEYIVDRTVLNEIDYDVNTSGVSAKKLKTAVTDLLTTEDYAGIVGNIANKLVEGYDLKGKKDALTLQRDINAALKAEIKELSTKIRYAEAEKNISMQIQNLTQSAKEFAKRKYSSQAFSGEEAQAVNAAFSKVVVRNKVNSDNAVAAIAVAKNFYTPERINGTTERETFGLYNQGVREDIEYLSETLESGKNLTFEQLKTLNNVMKAVTHVFRSIDTIIYDGKRRHTAEVASTAIAEQRALPRVGKKNRKSKAKCLAFCHLREEGDYLFSSDFFFLNEKREREFAGSISPAFVRAIFVATGPTSSYISVAQRTTVEICVPSDGISARTNCAIPIATPACGRRVSPRYF